MSKLQELKQELDEVCTYDTTGDWTYTTRPPEDSIAMLVGIVRELIEIMELSE